MSDIWLFSLPRNGEVLQMKHSSYCSFYFCVVNVMLLVLLFYILIQLLYLRTQIHIEVLWNFLFYFWRHMVLYFLWKHGLHTEEVFNNGWSVITMVISMEKINFTFFPPVFWSCLSLQKEECLISFYAAVPSLEYLYNARLSRDIEQIDM